MFSSEKQFFKHGLVKRPLTDKVLTRTQKGKRCIRNFFRGIWDYDGIMTNFLLVCSHFFLSLAVPAPLICYNVWVLIEATIFPLTPHDHTFTIMNALFPSTYHFWFFEVPARNTLYWSGGICIFYTCVAMLEAISYYATDLKNTGKYEVRKTVAKRALVFLFWTVLNVFIAFYAAVFTLFLIWALLGAIINPASYLPYAAGSATFIVFVNTQIAKLKKLSENLEEAVGEFIDEKLKNLIGKSFQDLQSVTDDDGFLEGAFAKKAKDLFGKALFKAITIGKPDAEMNDEALEKFKDGGFEELVQFISSSAGIHPIIIKSIVAMSTRTKDLLISTIGDICEKFEVDPALGKGVARISLDKFNPDKGGQNKVSGQVLISAKEILASQYKGFPLNPIDNLFEVIAEKDPKCFFDFLKQMNLPMSPFKIGAAFLTKEEDKIENELKDLMG